MNEGKHQVYETLGRIIRLAKFYVSFLSFELLFVLLFALTTLFSTSVISKNIKYSLAQCSLLNQNKRVAYYYNISALGKTIGTMRLTVFPVIKKPGNFIKQQDIKAALDLHLYKTLFTKENRSRVYFRLDRNTLEPLLESYNIVFPGGKLKFKKVFNQKSGLMSLYNDKYESSFSLKPHFYTAISLMLYLPCKASTISNNTVLNIPLYYKSKVQKIPFKVQIHNNNIIITSSVYDIKFILSKSNNLAIQSLINPANFFGLSLSSFFSIETQLLKVKKFPK